MKIDEILRDKIVELITKKILTQLAKHAAFLVWGPLGVISSYVISKILRYALDQTFLGASILYVTLDVNHDVGEVSKLAEEIKKLKPGMTKEKANELNEKLAKAYIDLIDFGAIKSMRS